MCTCFVPGVILNALFSLNPHSCEWEEVAVASETLHLPVVSGPDSVKGGTRSLAPSRFLVLYVKDTVEAAFAWLSELEVRKD